MKYISNEKKQEKDGFLTCFVNLTKYKALKKQNLSMYLIINSEN